MSPSTAGDMVRDAPPTPDEPLPRQPAAAVPEPVAGARPGGRAEPLSRPIAPVPVAPVLDIVVPVYNEERDLRDCVLRLHAHLTGSFPFGFRITVADNASTDGTAAIAARLAADLPAVVAVHLPVKGRGRALRTAWSASDATVLAYTDVDLSTDLAALLPLVAPLISGHSDLAIGTRLAHSARVVRGPKRELISRCYNLLLRRTLAAGFSDAQCGFKAIRRDVATRLLPLVRDDGWFFDTELLVLAERAGLRIHEVPVDWTDDVHSKVDIVATAREDLKGIVRLGRGLANGTIPVSELRGRLGRTGPPARIGGSAAAGSAAAGSAGQAGNGERRLPGVPAGLPRQLVSFAVIGVVSTLAYLLLFALLRQATGPQPANLVALLVTAIANTSANRRLTFGINGRANAARHQLQGLLVFALGLALTSGSLWILATAAPQAGRFTELSVLVAANLLATVVRFLLMRVWVFRRRTA
jgi:putative flippase GtrA